MAEGTYCVQLWRLPERTSFETCVRAWDPHQLWWRKAKVVDTISWVKNRLFSCILISDKIIRIQAALWERDLCWVSVFLHVWALRMVLQRFYSFIQKKGGVQYQNNNNVFWTVTLWAFPVDLLSLTSSEMIGFGSLPVLCQDYTHYQTVSLFLPFACLPWGQL